MGCRIGTQRRSLPADFIGRRPRCYDIDGEYGPAHKLWPKARDWN